MKFNSVYTALRLSLSNRTEQFPSLATKLKVIYLACLFLHCTASFCQPNLIVKKLWNM